MVHPTNPNIVYVAALGATWRANPERGLYKTTDGGTTWQLVKFISDKAGFVDVAMDPRNPNVLFAASWERFRTPYLLKSGGPGSALWKTTDGGTTWTESEGQRIPRRHEGPHRPRHRAAATRDYIYAMVEAADAKPNGELRARLARPKTTACTAPTDGGATWTQMNSVNVRPFYYSQVRVDPKNPDRVYFSSTQLQVSDDGGKTSRNAAQRVHVDDHGLWIDPNDPRALVPRPTTAASPSRSTAAATSSQPQNLPIAQFYEVSFDMAVPYNICGGAQDNGTWCGPSRRRSGTTHARVLVHDRRRRRLLRRAGPDRSEHRVRRVAGRQRVAREPAHRRAHGFQKPSWQEPLRRVGGLHCRGARRPARTGHRAT